MAVSSFYKRVRVADAALHAYFMERFPRATTRLDALLEFVFYVLTNGAFAVIVALLLIVLLEAEKITVTNGICLGAAWLIAFIWIARARRVREMTILGRMVIIVTTGVFLGFLGIYLNQWATFAYAKNHPTPVPTVPVDALAFDVYAMKNANHINGEDVAGIKWDKHFTDLRFTVINPPNDDLHDVDLYLYPDSLIRQAVISGDKIGCDLLPLKDRYTWSMARARKSGTINPEFHTRGTKLDVQDNFGDVYTEVAHSALQISLCKFPISILNADRIRTDTDG